MWPQLSKMRNHEVQKDEDESLMLEMARQIKDLEDQRIFRNMDVQNKNFELEQELEVLRAQLTHLNTEYDDTAKFLVQCMEDVKKKIVTVVIQESEGSNRPDYGLFPGVHFLLLNCFYPAINLVHRNSHKSI